MKAFVYERYGPPEVLERRELPRPEPKDNEVLIRLCATTVTAADWRVRSLVMPPGFALLARPALGLTRPRQPILGTELAGEIESVGKDVTKFRPGDQVFAFSGIRMGCYVEYKCLQENAAIAKKPANITCEEAATLCFGGTTALHFFREGRLAKGERILVNGASGGVGTAAVQLAKHLGATVTGVCSKGNMELVKSLGADRVIDYTREDFTNNGETYDVIMDTAGTAPFSRSRKSLVGGGRLLVVLGAFSGLFTAPFYSMTSGKKVIGGTAGERPGDVTLLGELAAAGEYKAVIDRRYTFEQMVDAHRYVDQGHKRGSVVVTL